MKLVAGCTAVALLLPVMAAADPPWKVVKPSNTGVPGEEVRLMAFDPDGNLWIAGRWPFWDEGGLAMLPASELPYAPLPGGGFETGLWTVYSNVDHPIPSVYTSDIEFAADGTIWLASDGGLTRFDRNAANPEEMWYTYTPGNSPLIMSPVRSLDLDSQGNLWLTNVSVQSSNGALFRFNPTAGEWTRYEVGQGLPWYLPWKDINAVLVGADDHVWLTHSTLGGLAEFNGTAWVLHDSLYQMEDLLEDLQGNIWITSSQYGLWKWNRASFQNFDLGSQGTVTALGLDPVTGLVYAGAWYGNIYKMIGGQTPQFFLNADNIPGSIWPRADGDVWINNYGGNGTLGTVRHYNATGQLLERFNTFNSGLPDYFIDNIQTDRAGNLWFACGEGGLSRFDGQRWRNWGNHNDLAEPYPFAGNEPMYAMFEDRDGNVWMGGNGVARWDPETGSFTGFWNWQNSSLGVDDMRGFAQQPDGTLWVGCGYSGAFRYDAPTDNWVQHTWAPPGWTANEVLDMTSDTAGNLWILTFVALHRLTPQGVWTEWNTTNSPLNWSLFSLERDPVDGVWVTVTGELHHFDGAVWTTTTQAEAGWPGPQPTSVAIRAGDGMVAVTTQQPEHYPYTGGVSVRDPDSGVWRHWTTANSPLTHWQVGAARFDAQGHLWVSAMSEGVVQIPLGPTAVPGDLDADGDVDLDDYQVYYGCISGPEGGVAGGCDAADLDGDASVDLADFASFQRHYGGA